MEDKLHTALTLCGSKACELLVSSLTSELKELKEENERYKKQANRWGVAESSLHAEIERLNMFVSDSAVDIAELEDRNGLLSEEITRLKGTTGSACAKALLEAREENAELRKALTMAKQDLIFLYAQKQNNKFWTELAELNFAKIGEALSKHQPIKKDEKP